MKKLLFLFVMTFTLFSCENDFDLTEDWKDVTVVYGLLDQSQPTQYIRIEKAFLDPATSALVLAQEADSLYYDNIIVRLVETPLSGTTSGNIFQLQRVNAIDEGFTRVEGVFATTPNILYKLTEPIREGFTYRLQIIKNGDSDNKIEAETEVCEDFRLTSPASFTTNLRFRAGSETSFRWTPPSSSKIFNLKLIIHYKEAPLANPTNTSTKQLVWAINNKIIPNEGDLAKVAIDGRKFFEFMAESLEPGFTRSLDSLDVEVGSGAVDLLNYINAGQVNGGITSSGLTSSYTNVKQNGEDAGVGILSSRFYKRSTGYTLESLSLDSLQSGYLTRDLGF